MTLAPRRLPPQPSSSPSLLASPTSLTWHTACAGPSLRMPGAGNTAACLRPRRVPGPGKPGTALRQLRLRPSTHARCWQHRRVPSSMMCPQGWQPRRDASSTSSPSWRTTTSTPLRPRLTRRPLAPAAPRRLPRHRPPRLNIEHGILRTATSTTAPPHTLSATSTNGTKVYRLLE